MTTIDVDTFREEARTWIEANLAPRPQDEGRPMRRDRTPEEMRVERALQRKLFDAGYAGITYTAWDGGLGLTTAHDRPTHNPVTSYAREDPGVAGGVYCGPI